MTSFNATPALSCGFELSVTVKNSTVDPATLGVPLMRPVDGLRLSPDGRAGLTENASGAVPPDVPICVE
jgi:hypothetical protein